MQHKWQTERYEKSFDASWMVCAHCGGAAWDDRFFLKKCSLWRRFKYRVRKFFGA